MEESEVSYINMANPDNSFDEYAFCSMFHLRLFSRGSTQEDPC